MVATVAVMAGASKDMRNIITGLLFVADESCWSVSDPLAARSGVYAMSIFEYTTSIVAIVLGLSIANLLPENSLTSS